MAVVSGYAGLVTSWGSPNSDYIDGSHNAPASFNLTETADQGDSTAFVASLLGMSSFPMMRAWEGTIECVRPTAVGGYGASIALSATNAYITNAFEYDLNLSCGVIPSTAFGTAATTARWKQFIAGLWDFAATWRAYIDGTTAPVAAGNATLVTATFTISSGVTIASLGYCSQLAIANDAKGQPVATMGFKGSLGATGIVVAGGTNPGGATTPMPIPTASSLVLTTATGRTLTGDAFPKSLSVRCPVDGQITTSIGFQGTGALTEA